MRFEDIVKCKKCGELYNSCSAWNVPKYCRKCATRLVDWEQETKKSIKHGATKYEKYWKPFFTSNAEYTIGYFKWFSLREFKRND